MCGLTHGSNISTRLTWTTNGEKPQTQPWNQVVVSSVCTYRQMGLINALYLDRLLLVLEPA